MRKDVTPHKSYPLPHPDNPAQADVERIREAIGHIDRDMERNTSTTTEAAKRMNKATTALREAIETFEQRQKAKRRKDRVRMRILGKGNRA